MTTTNIAAIGLAAEALPELIAVGVSRRSQGADDDASYSFPNQDAKMLLLCQAHGWALPAANIYHEEFVSGGNRLVDRPGLLRAVKDIEAGRAHVLVFAYKDRMDRDPGVRDEVIDRVEAKGGMVFTGDHGRDTNEEPTAQFNGTTLSAAARMMRRQAGLRSRDAVASSIADGKWQARLVPPGYRKGRDGRLFIHEAEAKAIRTMFAMRLDGAGIHELHRFMRSQGIERSVARLNDLLHTRTYLGEIHHGKYLPNPSAHPAIVDPDTFDAVQAMVIPRGPKAKSDALMARQGVLRCGSCGARMVVGTSGHGPRYRCPTTASPDCPSKQAIKAAWVDEAVEAKMRSHVDGGIGDAEGSASLLAEARAAADEAQRLDDDLQQTITRQGKQGVEDEPAAIEVVAVKREARDRARAHAAELSRAADAAAAHVNVGDSWDDLSLDERRALIRTFVREVRIRPGRGRERISIDMVARKA